MFNNDVPAKKVVKTLPAAGSRAAVRLGGQDHGLEGTDSRDRAAAPGLTLARGAGRLDKAHLEFKINGPVRGGEVVVAQTPDAGARVPLETTTVELTFGKRPGPDP